MWRNNHLTGEHAMRDCKGQKLENLKNYQWPASNLTAQDMKILSEVRNRTKKSISFLIHDAIQIAYR